MADSSKCSACVAARTKGAVPDPEQSHAENAREFGVSEVTIRRHWKHVKNGVPEKIGEEQDEVLLGKVDPTDIPEVTEATTTGIKSIRNPTAIRDRAVTLDDARQWLESTGDVPEDYHIALKSATYRGIVSNKMSAWPKPKPKATWQQKAWEAHEEIGSIDFDAAGVLAQLRRGTHPANFTPRPTGDGAFVLSLNDTQLGKAEGGGTEATIKRVAKFLTGAERRVKELRYVGRELGTLVIIGGGDIVEGCVIYPNQSYSIDLDRRGQINAAVTMILDVIDRMAPLFDRVIVLAARGNHGENRINGNRTTLYDNDDTMVFEMAKQATDRDQALKHVQYIIAESEAGVYVDVAGWRLATTHGDVYGKGVSGATKEKKAHAWYKNMAGGRDPLGLADILVTHHYHHSQMADWGACLWRQTPALDGGSEYYRQSTGEHSEPGMLTFVITPNVRYGDELVIS